MTEQQFLATGHVKCPMRVEMKDLKWSKKDIKSGLRDELMKHESEGELKAYCKATPGGPDDDMYICQRARKSGTCPALIMIREKHGGAST